MRGCQREKEVGYAVRREEKAGDYVEERGGDGERRG